MARAYLSLGSNQQPERHLQQALSALQERFGALTVSPTYRSNAVGFHGPAFLNLAVGIDVELSPHELVVWLRALEDRAGRRRDKPRFSSRTLDVDLLLYDDSVISDGTLLLPRPELLEQAFVLKPMVDIAPDLRHPLRQRSLAALWDDFPGDRTLETLQLPIAADDPPEDPSVVLKTVAKDRIGRH